MKRPYTSLLACAVLALGTTSLTAQEQADFEKGLTVVERAMDKGQWSKASSSLQKLLEEHAKQGYVYYEKQRILQDMERIALFLEYEAPEADDVLAGKVKKYDPSRGRIEVEFSGEDLSDFNKGGDAYTLPVTLTGPYSVEFKGDIYPTSNPISIATGWGTDACYMVHMGDKGHLPTITWRKGERDSEFLDTSEKQPMKLNKPYQILVEVKSTKVTVKANKKKLMEAKRPKIEYGLFGFFGMDDYERESLRITFKGEIETSWIAGKIDEVMQERRVEFETGYRPKEYLPEWLFDESFAAGEEEDDVEAEEASSGGSLRDRAGRNSRKPRTDGGEDAYFRKYPGEEPGADGSQLADELIFDTLTGDYELEEALAELAQALEEEEISDAVAAFVEMVLYRYYGRLEDAADAGHRVLAEDPEHRPTILMQAVLLARLRDLDAARAMLEDARSRWPKSDAVIESLVEIEVLDQKLEVAQQLVKQARAAGMLRKEGEALQAKLDKAVSGPHWPKTYSHESRHYDIRSDMSKDICKEASRLLESAYNSYSIHLQKVKGLEKNKFRVFLFSGEAGYHRYASESFGSSRENTAGLFSPFLKQLLIWNVPSRESMMRTVVHEGFHQYLDQIAPETPRWFNEGMAEYFELYETVNGKFTEGQVNPGHVEMLLEKSIPLERFLKMPTEAFYRGDVGLHYAQGWAFVHFLRNSDRERKQLFDDLFQGFADSPSSGQVLEDVLGDVDMRRLESDFRAHIRSLREK